MFFASDNGLPASEKIMAAVLNANADGPRLAYGRDDATTALEARIGALFETEVRVFLVSTGSAANGLALSTLTPPWGIVLCHQESHVMEDECCGPEFYTGGAKLVGIEGVGAKITAAALAEKLALLPRRVPHNAPVHALTLTQSTELGQVYTVDEVKALTAIAKSHGLATHMDGARFANAVAHLGCKPAEITWKAGIDVLSFGATKGGALTCEAIVYFDLARAEEMTRRRMRGGHLLSKHRYMVAQMEAFLDADHWLDLSRHANAMALRLYEGLKQVPGVHVPLRPQANGVFPVMPTAMIERLKAKGAVFYPWAATSLPLNGPLGDDRQCMRLVTSFLTTEAEVEAFVAAAGGG